MSDKDQFTFDDGDDFPEADLSSAFADGELEAENPAPEPQEEIVPSKKGKKPKKVKTAKSEGGSRTRLLLILLLLVVVAGAGAYYFMELGETTPSVPTAPAKEAKTAVALPPKPAKPATAEPAAAEPAPQAVTVAVPPPPPPTPAQETAPPAPVPQPTAPEAKEAPQPVTAQPPAPAVKAETVATAPPAEPVVVPPPPEPAVELKTVAAPAQVADGAFALDAGSYLLDANRDALIAKIKQLGYEPLVTPVDATLDMTRLRLGTFGKDEVQQALDFARSIEPGAYSAPAGDNYVIYAGTFLSKGSIDSLTKRFAKEGIKVYPEPVQVVRTLSRIRFGGFATKADAEIVAKLAADKGVKAVVVKAK